MIHLICNAHIDPAWLWEWEEGTAAALSTFRAAADFCEEYDSFVFNHNEALLYEYIEELDPMLFARIQTLVTAGRWVIMGGWYLQPDCNMPSGESLLRQIETGQNWFRKKFGVSFGPGAIETAINLDPFGHSLGLVQLLRKSGYSSYLICRPGPGTPGSELPADLFSWKGLDGSQVTVLRSPDMYNSGLGKVGEKITAFLQNEKENRDPGLLLWGVGNHGGGPSRRDIETIAELSRELPLIHSTPEQFFREFEREGGALRKEGGVLGKEGGKSERVNGKPERVNGARLLPIPTTDKGLNPWGTGCYTSQIRIKQKHRELEYLLFSVEKLAVQAMLLNLAEYPHTELAEAQRDLLMMDFHDILPGSGVEAVEAYGLQLAGHGLEILKRVRFRMLCALLKLEAPFPPGTYPVYAYNPHPYPVSGIFALELQLADQNRGSTWTHLRLMQEGREIPSQVEKEASNIPIDWRKKISFAASLKPGLNRLTAYAEELHAEKPAYEEQKERFRFTTESMVVEISRITGLITSLMIDGCELTGPEGILPVVLDDSDDPWSMEEAGNLPEKGRFRLMESAEAAVFRGIAEEENPPPVTVIETGDVRHIVEVLMRWGRSDMVLNYCIPASGIGIDLSIRVFWHELHARLKLRIPTDFEQSKRRCETQIMAGREELEGINQERVGQQWAAVHNGEHALAVINDGTYGLDFDKSVLRISMLHSPAYAAHPVDDREIVSSKRWSPRIDHGVRSFTFRITGGRAEAVLDSIDREARTWGEAPYLLSVFPLGVPEDPGAPEVPDAPDAPESQIPAAVVIEGAAIVLLSIRELDPGIQGLTADRSRRGRTLFLRLQESTGKAAAGTISFPALFPGVQHEIYLEPFEIAAYQYEVDRGNLVKCRWLVQPGNCAENQQ